MINYKDVVEYWQDKKISTVSELETAINGKIIALAYHSGKLENEAITYNDTREIFEHDRVVSYTGDLRTLFEIRNAKDAFVELLGAFEKKLPLDEVLICRFHYQLTKNTYDKSWIIVNKVDKKLERGEKFRFKIIRGKKIDSRMRTIRIVKSVNILKQGNL